MLTEPPGEALVRASTYTLSLESPAWIDLTTVYEQPPVLTMEEFTSIDLKTANGGTSDSSRLASTNITGRPLHTEAIYDIDGSRMTYCVAPPGQPRPTELVTKKGDGYTLVSLQRKVSE